MANYKRKKPRSQVRCTMCTDARQGKDDGRHPRKSKKFWPKVEDARFEKES